MSSRGLNQQRSNPSSSAFTSIELLVVIVVLALLTAIVLPALARSGEKDIRVVCLNNEKQLYMSLHIYCDDNGDRLPILAGGGFWAWDMPTPITTAMLGDGCTKKMFYCPSTTPRFTDQQNWAGGNSLWNYGGSSFATVGYIFAFGGPNSTIAALYQNQKILSELHINTSSPGNSVFTDTPSTRELIADVIISTGNVLPASAADNFSAIAGGFGLNGVLYPHLSAHLGRGQVPAGGNIAYKDGHVAWKKFDASNSNTAANNTKVRTTLAGPYFWW